MTSKLAAIRTLSILALAAAPLSAQTPGPAAWSQSVWTAASQGDTERFHALLADLPSLDPASREKLARSTSLLQHNLVQREDARKTEIAETEQRLQEHLDKGRDFESLRQALREAVALQILTQENDESSFALDPRIADLVRNAEAGARSAEADGRWLVAGELWRRLDVLFEKEQTYKPDVRRATQRLMMIVLYTPERWWEMRNTQQLRENDEPLPPFNATGTGFQDKLDGIRPDMVIRAIVRAAESNVHDQKMSELLRGGIAGVRTMIDTHDLRHAFPGLADQDATARFIAFLDEESAELERLGVHATQADLRATMRELLKWNKQTVNLHEPALLHEFGNGAMNTLDEFSTIIWPDQLRRFERSTRGSFIGVGIQIQLDERFRIKVVAPLEDTPAQRAGIRSGDIIKAVDGKSALGFTLDQAVDVITGPRDTPVTLTIERENADGETTDFDVPLVRKQIALYSVKGWERAGPAEQSWNWFIDPEYAIGYVRLTTFSQKTSGDFDLAVREMKRQGLSSLILDLRFNPGGLLDQAVAVSSRFIDADLIKQGMDPLGPPGVRNGVIVSTHDKTGSFHSEPEIVQNISDRRKLGDIPIVVLVNQSSASASEIVAGALQDYADAGIVKAVILGQTSYGKGSVQNVWPISRQGFNARNSAALKLTTQYYRLPGGRMIHRKAGQDHGVMPDLFVDMLPDQVAQALLIRRDADVILVDEHGQPIVDADRPKPWDLISLGHDLQLQTALVLLQTQHPSLATNRAAMSDEQSPTKIP